MSTYVVEDSTINKVVGLVYRKTGADSLYGECYRRLCAMRHGPQSPDRDDPEDGGKRLGLAMHMLNVGAVRQRYDDADAAGMIPEAYRYRPDAASDIAGYKALCCWLYQCNEGRVPQSDLYKAMAALANRLARGFVEALPEYAAAAWG